MDTLNFFEPVDPSDEPEYEETGCTCPPGDNRYQLEIEEGQAQLVHAACGKQPPSSWGDWHDLVTMEAIPVTLEWVPECDGDPWHGDQRCDCGASVQLTPEKPVATDCPACDAGIEHDVHCPTPETHNWGCGCPTDPVPADSPQT